MIQRLEEAQINSVEFVWSLLNYSKAFLSSLNSVSPTLCYLNYIYKKLGEIVFTCLEGH